MSTNNLLTVQQVARELNISVRAVQHRITVGSLAAEKLGEGRTSAYVVTRDEVDRAKAAAQNAPAAS